MEQERIHSLKHDPSDWLGFGSIDSNEEARRFFAEARERFAKHSSGSDMFDKFVRDHEHRFSQRFSHFLDISRDFNTTQHPVSSLSIHEDPISEAFPEVTPGLPLSGNSFPRFPSFGRFPRPRFSHILMGSPTHSPNISPSWGESEKIELSRSTFYRTHINSYRFSSDQINNCYEAYESESESEDEESAVSAIQSPVARKAIEEPCGESIAPSEISASGSEVDAQKTPDQTPEQRKDRLFRLANELLMTERSYVSVLNLIDQVFHFRVDHENRAHPMFPQETVPHMFSNIKSIYKLHNEFLLPQLEERMKSWDLDPRIGDIMKIFAPFLKLYTEYVKNFDSAMSLINMMQMKNSRFAAIMHEIHQMPECGNLTLTHHMLSPIQRIPRYELLLKDYLKKLSDDSNDRTDTERALHLVSSAANHANEAMKKISQFQQLLEIQENISGAVDLVSPTRELLREGKVHKISARSGDHQERYLFLFSDVLLLCSPRLISNRVISGPTYRLRVKFDVESLQVLEGDNMETENTFYVQAYSKKVELYTQTSDEKLAWLDALCTAVQELYKRKSSLRISPESSNGNGCVAGQGAESSKYGSLDSDLGKRAPTLVQMDTVSRCKDCASSFGVMRRKHHCHACGLVVCGKCSGHKLPLQFEDNKMCRVCQTCHKVLTQRSAPNSPEISSSSAAGFSRGKGVLEVAAKAPCVLSGYMQLKTSKSWVPRWFALHSDFVLYSFRSHTDRQAMTATPVPGFTVSLVLDNKGEPEPGKEKTFKMFHKKKTYYFLTNSREDTERWVRVLELASHAELPSPDGSNTKS
ncbi:FYVE, RhoGEF and PH domain-containing protein 4-like isoform X2 [Thrips palmi]|uniref:FYVE, RhoGEF and PH domain-containing protein 4-like isoform X2 n=1 Tax=Thrips palmi TaxID=161013 RepID=A0A6P8YSF6_THRPL|nr:FYVE, RhoGEF and PH domain-containing protein 4-like isoform X2 [Thrips palmi]